MRARNVSYKRGYSAGYSAAQRRTRKKARTAPARRTSAPKVNRRKATLRSRAAPAQHSWAW